MISFLIQFMPCTMEHTEKCYIYSYLIVFYVSIKIICCLEIVLVCRDHDYIIILTFPATSIDISSSRLASRRLSKSTSSYLSRSSSPVSSSFYSPSSERDLSLCVSRWLPLAQFIVANCA